jgi:hypothetical protein
MENETLSSEHVPSEECKLDLKLLDQDIVVLADKNSLLEWSSISSFPTFKSFNEFKTSSFFQQYYDLWDEVLRFNRAQQVLQMYWVIDVTHARNLQRIFTGLWYMQKSNFHWNYCDINADDQFCEWDKAQDDALFYFWVFWVKTQIAVWKFQVNNCLDMDYEVWVDTSNVLFHQIYDHLHVE